jgi:methylmalonyl-CoA mutase C-terminal domain/subunit
MRAPAVNPVAGRAALRPPVRAIVAKVGLDGHDRGVKVVARAFRDAGMEVIYTGLRRRPEELAEIAIQEDAEVLGLSILSGAALPLTGAVLRALEQRGAEAVVVVGGIFGGEDRERLGALGVAGVFGPGTPLTELVDVTLDAVRARRAEGGRDG